MTSRIKEHPIDLAWWVKQMQETIDARIGRRLWRDFVKRVCSRVDSAQTLSLNDDHDVLRYLWRLGFVPLGSKAADTVSALLRKASELSALSPLELTITIKVFSSGYYGIADNGVCADTPACSDCPFRMFCSYALHSADLEKLPESESFRSRLALGAQGVLGVPELLALLVSGGKNEIKAFLTVQKLLTAAGSLRALASWSLKEFTAFKGLSQDDAVRIRSALDLAVFWASEPRPPGAKFSTARDFVKFYKPRLRDRKVEYFVVTMLDNKNRIIGEVLTGGGGISGADVDPRAVLKQAVRDSAAHVAFIHNHPSGDPTPSTEDLEITARLVQVCNLAGIKVLDHIIIGADSYVSMTQDGYM